MAFVAMLLALQLHRWNLWPDAPWSFVLVPAAFGSAYLALTRPGNNLLTTLVFFPMLVALMFYAGACLPLGATG